MAHLDRPYKDWATTVGSVPADAMHLPHHGRIAPGLPANMVLFKGRGYSELLARPQWDRVTPLLPLFPPLASLSPFHQQPLPSMGSCMHFKSCTPAGNVLMFNRTCMQC